MNPTLVVTITMETKWLAVVRVNGKIHAKLQYGSEYEIRVKPLEYETQTTKGTN